MAKEVKKQLETVLANFPPVKIEMTDDERCAAALALPERAFTGEYDRLFGSDDETKTEMEIES